jgi:hypothetical protein
MTTNTFYTLGTQIHSFVFVFALGWCFVLFCFALVHFVLGGVGD